MQDWAAMGWVILGVLLTGVVLLTAAVWLYWQGRKQVLGSLHYILDRMGVVEADLRRLDDGLQVLQEQLRRRGLLDEDDLQKLEHELTARRQQEAEQQDLVRQTGEPELAARLVKPPSETLH